VNNLDPCGNPILLGGGGIVLVPSWVPKNGNTGIGLGGGGISGSTNPVLFACPTGTQVGIGTNSPLATLDVIGDGRFTSNLNILASLNVGSFTTISNGLAIGSSYSNTNPNNYRNGLIVQNNVGIGTNNPTMGNLQVTNTASGVNLYIDHSGTQDYDYASIIKVANNTTKAFVIKNGTTDNCVIDGKGDAFFNGSVGIGTSVTATSTRSFNLAVGGDSFFNGNVGIGTEAVGTCKLAVEGIIGARGIVVPVGVFPDFVFEKNYHLMTLDELEKYISENGHLPEMPSAKDVEENNGVELGLLTKTLLEKIEQLTLYTIEQKNILKIQEEKIRKLEQAISK
jgi:hypothetical protein